MRSFYQELCRHGIILNHRIMALDAPPPRPNGPRLSQRRVRRDASVLVGYV